MREILLLSVCFLCVSPCAARIISVDDDGPADFNNIQAPINDANDGGLVMVQPGTYTGEHGLCPKCNFIDRLLYPKPVDRAYQPLWLRLLASPSGMPFMTGFIIGRCLRPGGAVLQDYVTCYSLKYLVLRGNRQSRYSICRRCGTITSQVKPGPQYVLARQLSEAKVYQDAQCRFLLTEEPAACFDFKDWELDENSRYCMWLEVISIREDPADGRHLSGDP
ncbi:MAG: hypothetical protein ACYTEQ_24980 [Planctomycetota bacterium]|jgi:hypothetical protein